MHLQMREPNRQAEAKDVKAKADLRRYKQLLDKHEIAESEYDQVMTRQPKLRPLSWPPGKPG